MVTVVDAKHVLQHLESSEAPEDRRLRAALGEAVGGGPSPGRQDGQPPPPPPQRDGGDKPELSETVRGLGRRVRQVSVFDCLLSIIVEPLHSIPQPRLSLRWMA